MPNIPYLLPKGDSIKIEIKGTGKCTAARGAGSQASCGAAQQ